MTPLMHTPTVPNGWIVKKLSNIGVTYSGLSGKTKSDFGIGKPYVTYVNIYSNPKINLVDVERVSIKENENQNRIMYGDVLFTSSSETADEVGISSVVFEKNIGEIYLNSFCFGYRLYDFNSLLPEFAQYYFRATAFRKLMNTLAQGASRYNLPKRYFLETEVILPPLREQSRITTILAVWDRAVQNLKKEITIKKIVSKGLINELLSGKRRLSTFTGAWKTVEIGDIAKQVSIRNINGDTLTVLSCTKYSGLVKSLEYFGRQVFGDNLAAYKVIKKNQFAYATNHIEEGSLGYQNLEERALISPMYTVFETFGEVDDYFLFSLLKTPRMIYLYQSNMSGSIARRGGLRWNTFSTLPITIPHLEEQRAIGRIIKTTRDEIDLLEKKLHLLEKQRKFLLNNLVTGKIRAPESLKVHQA